MTFVKIVRENWRKSSMFDTRIKVGNITRDLCEFILRDPFTQNGIARWDIAMEKAERSGNRNKSDLQDIAYGYLLSYKNWSSALVTILQK